MRTLRPGPKPVPPTPSRRGPCVFHIPKEITTGGDPGSLTGETEPVSLGQPWEGKGCPAHDY